MNLFAGVDIGSTTAKCVITDENDNMLVFEHIPTEYDRNVSGEKILKQAMDKLGVSEADIAISSPRATAARASCAPTPTSRRLSRTAWAPTS